MPIWPLSCKFYKFVEEDIWQPLITPHYPDKREPAASGRNLVMIKIKKHVRPELFFVRILF